MTPTKVDYRNRKDMVLGIVVNEYIKTVSPVSSGHIAHGHILSLSPATIRNILAELEQDGYLTHPHTSSGRVPTQEGYRYYVDHLMEEINLLEMEKQRIKAEYEQEVKNLEDILDKTSEVISELTQYTSIISVDGREDRIFCKGTGYVVEYPDSRDIGKIRNILKILEKKERILEIINRQIKRKTNIYIGHEMACSDVDGCSLVVSGYKTRQGESGRIAVLGPTRMDYQRVVCALDYFSDLINKIL